LRWALVTSAVLHAGVIALVWAMASNQEPLPNMRVYAVDIVSPPPQIAGEFDPGNGAPPQIAPEAHASRPGARARAAGGSAEAEAGGAQARSGQTEAEAAGEGTFAQAGAY
jgi:hypothetical protein